MGTMIYELSGREEWESGRDRPNLQIFLLRLNMNLIAGLTTGMYHQFFLTFNYSLSCLDILNT